MYKLMIADDNPHILKELTESTDWENFDFHLVGTFLNGEDLLEAAKQDIPDLVITDISMPIMDGIQLSTHLYQLKPKMKIIFISSYSDFDYARTALKLNIFDYILKPIRLNQLLRVCEKVFTELHREQLEYFDKMKTQSEQEYFQKVALSHYATRLLFHAEDEQYIRDEFAQLGLTLSRNTTFYIICFSLNENMDTRNKMQTNHYLASFFEQGRSNFSILPLTLENHNGIFLLMLHNQASPVEDILAELCVDIETRMRIRVTMAYSRSSKNLTDLPILYKQALETLKKLMEENIPSPIAAYQDLLLKPEINNCHSTFTEQFFSKNIAAMRNFIEQHYMEPITTNDVARIVYLSPTYANHCFATECGISIHGYILQYRLEKSKQLLCETDEYITRIAELVGYCNKTSFYLAFKRYTGISPTEYRQKYPKDQDL